MNIVIVGIGEVGYHLAKVLSQERHEITVIDLEYQKIKHAKESLDVRTILGDGTKPKVLEQSECESADLLLAVSSNDHANMLACLFGRRMGARKTVLRVKDQTPFEGFKTFFKRAIEFDLVISLEDLASEEIVRQIRHKSGAAVQDFADGRVQLRRVHLEREKVPQLLEVPLRKLELPAGVLVVAVSRAGETLVPGGDDVLKDGDTAYVIGEAESVEEFERTTGADLAQATSVVVLGDLGVGLSVARRLEAQGLRPRMLVEERNVAEKVSSLLRHTLVLQADGTDLTAFKEERIGESDAFIGACSEDERNLMSCQLAKSLGTQRTLALVTKPDYVKLYQQLGVDVAVSPRLLCADKILSFIRGGAITTMASIEEGAAEVIELTAREGSKVLGKPLAKINFPRNAKVAAVLREGGEVLIPGRDDVLLAGDTLIVFTAAEALEDVVQLVSGQD
jgi:trk system potassium uptake protein TrkA